MSDWNTFLKTRAFPTIMDAGQYHGHGGEGIILRTSKNECFKVFYGDMNSAKDLAEHEYTMLCTLFESEVHVPQPFKLTHFELNKKNMPESIRVPRDLPLGGIFRYTLPEELLYGIRPAIHRRFVIGQDAGPRIFSFHKKDISNAVQDTNQQIERAGYIFNDWKLPHNYIIDMHGIAFAIDCASVKLLTGSYEIGWSKKYVTPIMWHECIR
jgi:hypothetical protein